MENKIKVIRSINDYVSSDITDNQFKNSVIVYCRVSTVSQIDGSSLDTQQQNGIEYFEKSDIQYKFIIIVREEGKSGDDYNSNQITDRPLLGVILNKIDKDLIKHFWIFDSSRLSRSVELSTIIMKTLSQNNCNLYINTTKQNFDELENGLMLKILTVFDEYENHKRYQKSTLGKVENMKKGKWNGGSYPFGYKKGDYSGHIVIDKYQSKYVRKIFKLFNNGTSVKDLIIYLSKENVLPPKTNKTVWNEGTIRNLLRSRKYIGEHIVQTKTDKHLSKEECIEKNKIIISKINFPKIINDKLFNEVSIKMKNLVSKSNSNKKVEYQYLLKDLMYCGNCGNTMKINRNKSESKKVYRCNYSEKSWKYIDDRFPKCGKGYTKQIDIDVVEDLVWNEILDTYKNSYIIKEQFKNEVLPNRLKDREEPYNQIKSYNKSITNYLNKIEKLEKNKIELFKQKLTLKINESEYENIENSINEEIDVCNIKILEKESEIEITNDGIEWYDWLEDFDKYYNLIRNYKTFKEKREFITQFVDKINVYWDNISNTHKLVVTFKLKIVKDRRINKEKYVFKVLNGQNDKVINDINSIKYKKILNKKSHPNWVRPNHSTVVDCFGITHLVPKNSKTKLVESIDFSFDLIVRTSKLTKTSHYNTYQQKLYRLVKFLKEERGIGYRRISHILTEKGYRSVRTNSILKNSYIYTIYSKGKIRENRINRSFDSKIENIKYIFKYSD